MLLQKPKDLLNWVKKTIDTSDCTGYGITMLMSLKFHNFVQKKN